MILIIISAVGTFFLMECVAWFMHKFVMHGFAWKLHEDHHVKENHKSILELNDSFFVFFAVLSILAFLTWTIFSSQVSLGIGIGISLYGATYFFVHDLFIHQRIKVLRNTKNKYFLALRRAHKIHHKKLDKHEGECFGMLWVPLKYFRQ